MRILIKDPLRQGAWGFVAYGEKSACFVPTIKVVEARLSGLLSESPRDLPVEENVKRKEHEAKSGK